MSTRTVRIIANKTFMMAIDSLDEMKREILNFPDNSADANCYVYDFMKQYIKMKYMEPGTELLIMTLRCLAENRFETLKEEKKIDYEHIKMDIHEENRQSDRRRRLSPKHIWHETDLLDMIIHVQRTDTDEEERRDLHVQQGVHTALNHSPEDIGLQHQAE